MSAPKVEAPHGAADHPPEAPKKAADAHGPGHGPEVAGKIGKEAHETKGKAAEALKGAEKAGEHAEKGKHEAEKHGGKHDTDVGPHGRGELETVPEEQHNREDAEAAVSTSAKVAGLAAVPVALFYANGTAMGKTALEAPLIAKAAAGTVGNAPFAAQRAIDTVLGVNGSGQYWHLWGAGKDAVFAGNMLSGALLGAGAGAMVGGLLYGKKGAAWGGGIGAVGGVVAGNSLATLTPAVAPYVLPGLLGYGGYKLGKWIEDKTGLHPVLARGAGTVGGVAAGSYFAGNAWLFQNTIGAIPQALSYIGPLGVVGIGALAGYGIGKKWFGNGKLGAIVGGGAGGVGALALSGVAAGTALSAVALPGIAAGAAYYAGRKIQDFLGWERRGITGTIFDATVKAPLHAVSWLGRQITSPFRGVARAIENRRAPEENILGRATNLATNAALYAPRSAAAAGYGLAGVNSDLKNRFPYRAGRNVGSAAYSVVTSPKRAWNWLWAQRAGGHGDDHGHGGH